MTQIGTPAAVVKRGSASSDIYTVLTLVALLALVVGVGYVCYRSAALFGGGNPFAVRPAAVAPR